MQLEAQHLGLGPLFWTGVASATAGGADFITGLVARKKAAEEQRKTAKSQAEYEKAVAELQEVNAELEEIQKQQFMLYALTAGALVMGAAAGYGLARYAHKRSRK